MYDIVLSEYVIRQFKKINRQMVPSLKAAIAELARDPRPHNYIKLTNQEAYRIRGSF